MNLQGLWCVLVIIAFSMPVFAESPRLIDSFDDINDTNWVEAGGQAGWGSYMEQANDVNVEGTGSMKIDFTQYSSPATRDEPFRYFDPNLDCNNYEDLAITLWVWVKDPNDTRQDSYDSRLRTIVLTDSTFSEYTPAEHPNPKYNGNIGFFEVPPFKTAGWNKVIAPLRNFLWRDCPWADIEGCLVDPNTAVLWDEITNIGLLTTTTASGDHNAIYIDELRFEWAPNEPARPYQMFSYDNIWDELWQETHGTMEWVLQTPAGDANGGVGTMMIDYENITDVFGQNSDQEPKTALIPALDFTDGNDWSISVWVWSDLPNPYGTAFDDSYLWEIILYDAGGNVGHYRVPRQDFDAGTGWTKVTARIDEFLWEKPGILTAGAFPNMTAKQANLEAIVAVKLWNMDYPHFGNNIYLDDLRIEAAVEALSEAVVYNADYGTITVDGNTDDWAAFVDSDIIDFDLADANIKGSANGNLHVKYRLAWDPNYLYILVEEQPGDDLAWEATSRSDLISGTTNTAGTKYDSLALSLDFTNNRLPSVDVHMALYLILGLDSTGATDLLVTCGQPSSGPGPSFRWADRFQLRPNASVATSGTLGSRVIEARLKWTDLESAIPSWYQPDPNLLAAVKAGFIFGADPHLQDLDNKDRYNPDADHGAAWFSGADNPIQWPQGNFRWPTGRDKYSTDIRLVYSAGDLDFDTDVDFADYTQFAAEYSETDCNNVNDFCNGADILTPMDGDVDLEDLARFSLRWLLQ